MEEEVLAALLDPAREPVPLGEDRLVRDLDGRRPRPRVAVEGEQAVLAEAVEDRLERAGLELEWRSCGGAPGAACPAPPGRR